MYFLNKKKLWRLYAKKKEEEKSKQKGESKHSQRETQGWRNVQSNCHNKEYFTLHKMGGVEHSHVCQ